MRGQIFYFLRRLRAKGHFTCVLLLLGGFLRAQDIHFTQFFSNPLILNPSQTGYFQGNMRIGFNFKAQWPFAIASPTVYTYHTESPYIDFSFGEKKLKSGWMGIGFGFLNDEAGDGILTYRRFLLSYAYHQAFDKEQRYVLSAGVVGSYIIRSVDYSKFYFNDQWVQDMGFNTSLDSREPFARSSYGQFDLGAGLNFGGQISRVVKLELGYSMLHLNEPSGGFYTDETRLGFRYQATGGVDLTLSERVGLNIQGYYGYEKAAHEAVAGAMVRYVLTHSKTPGEDNAVYFGAYYRIDDALTPLFGFEVKRTRLLLSYDITLSKLIAASQANGGPEASLIYVISWGKDMNGKKLYCPRF